jgi:hypothetical protein
MAYDIEMDKNLCHPSNQTNTPNFNGWTNKHTKMEKKY